MASVPAGWPGWPRFESDQPHANGTRKVTTAPSATELADTKRRPLAVHLLYPPLLTDAALTVGCAAVELCWVFEGQPANYISVDWSSRQMRDNSEIQRFPDYIVQILLIGAAVTSIAVTILGVSVKWYLPGIFMGIYAVYRQVAADLEDCRTSLTQYLNSAQYYSDLQQRVQRATQTVWLTYMRVKPPPGYGEPEADRYLRFTIEWARIYPDRELRRVFAASDDGPLTDWLLAHYRECKGVANYHPRVVPTLCDIDAINVGIFDAASAVLVFTGKGTSLSGVTFGTTESIQAFREWYLQLWDVAEPLAAYVDRVEHLRFSGI
jgi:hypothetical protein